MPAQTLALPVIEVGATYKFSFTYKNKTTNTPVDLTGVTAKMQIRKAYTDAAYLLELSTENGRISIDIPTGRFSFLVTDEVTSTLIPDIMPKQKCVYDLELYWPNGEVQRLLEGTVQVKMEVTRG